MIYIILGVLVFAAFLGLGSCQLCKLFIDETTPERGFVADVEHNVAGQPLTGWKLQAIRIAEMVFNPLCAPINRWLGRSS